MRAWIGPHQPALGEGGQRAPDGVSIDSEPERDLDLAGQPRVGRVAAVRNRALDLVGDPTPKRDTGGLGRADRQRAVAPARKAAFHGGPLCQRHQSFTRGRYEVV